MQWDGTTHELAQDNNADRTTLLQIFSAEIDSNETMKRNPALQDMHAQCKTTKKGQEYQGTLSHTITDEPCVSWSLIDKYQDSDFPDGSIYLAQNFCRNPNNAAVGPWCFFEKANNT